MKSHSPLFPTLVKLPRCFKNPYFENFFAQFFLLRVHIEGLLKGPLRARTVLKGSLTIIPGGYANGSVGLSVDAQGQQAVVLCLRWWHTHSVVLHPV